MAKTQEERTISYENERKEEGLARMASWIPNTREDRKKLRAAAKRLRKAGGLLLPSERD